MQPTLGNACGNQCNNTDDKKGLGNAYTCGASSKKISEAVRLEKKEIVRI